MSMLGGVRGGDREEPSYSIDPHRIGPQHGLLPYVNTINITALGLIASDSLVILTPLKMKPGCEVFVVYCFS
jgi:hypothetical protein